MAEMGTVLAFGIMDLQRVFFLFMLERLDDLG